MFNYRMPLAAAPQPSDILSALQNAGHVRSAPNSQAQHLMLNALGVGKPSLPILRMSEVMSNPVMLLARPPLPLNRPVMPSLSTEGSTSSRMPVDRDYIRSIIEDHRNEIGYIGAK